MQQELLRLVSAFLAGRFARKGLETWLLCNLQTILNSGEERTIALANAIDADLIALNEGLLDVATFAEQLQAYLSRAITIEPQLPGTGIPANPNSSGVASETVKTWVEVPGPTVDLRLAPLSV